MPNKKTYQLGKDKFDIPVAEAQAFLADNPDAIELSSFVVDKDTFDIPLPEVDAFLVDFPNAKPTFEEPKKKESAASIPFVTGGPSPIASTQTAQSSGRSQSQNGIELLRGRSVKPASSFHNETPIKKKGYTQTQKVQAVKRGFEERGIKVDDEKIVQRIQNEPDKFDEIVESFELKDERDEIVANAGIDTLLQDQQNKSQSLKNNRTALAEYQQSRQGKISKLVSDVMEGTRISDDDFQYLSKYAPKATKEILETADQYNPDFPVQNVNTIADQIKAKKEAEAQTQNFTQIQKQISLLGKFIDVNKLGTGAIVSDVENLRNKMNDEIAAADKKYAPTFNTNVKLSSFGTVKDNPEQNAEIGEIEQKYGAVIQSIANAEAFAYAKKNPKATPMQVGLEWMKIQDPTKYQVYQNGGTISKDIESAATVVGISILESTGDKTLIQKAQDEKSELATKFPEQMSQDVRRKLAMEYAKRNGINSVYNIFGLTLEDADEIARTQLSAKDRDLYFNYIRPNDLKRTQDMRFLGSGGSFFGKEQVITIPSLGGAVNEFFAGAAQPLYGTLNTVAGMFESKKEKANRALRTDVSAEKLIDRDIIKSGIEELEAKETLTVPEINKLNDLRGEYELKSKRQVIADGMFNLTGQVVMQGLLTKGTAPIVSTGLKAVGLGARGAGYVNTAEKIAAYAGELKNTSNIAGSTIAYLSSYDDARMEAERLMPTASAGAKMAYAGGIAALNAGTERIFKDEKILDAFRREVAPELAVLVQNLSARAITENAFQSSLTKLFNTVVKKVLPNAAIENQKEAIEEAVTQVGTTVLKGIGVATGVIDERDFDIDSETDALGQVYMETTISGLPIGVLGGISNVRRNNISQQAVYDFSRDPEKVQQYIDVINYQIAQGTMKQGEGIQKVQAANTLQEIATKVMPSVESKKELNDREKVALTSLFFAKRKLNNDIVNNPDTKTLSESNLAIVNKKIDDILLGKVAVDDNFDTYTPEEFKAKIEQEKAAGTPQGIGVIETKDALGNTVFTVQNPNGTKETFFTKQEADDRVVELSSDIAKPMDLGEAPVLKGEPEKISQPVVGRDKVKEHISTLADDNYLFTHVTTEDNARSITENGMSISLGTGISSTLTASGKETATNQAERLMNGEVVHRDLNNNSVAIISVPKAELDKMSGKTLDEKFENWLVENNHINDKGQLAIPKEFNAGYLSGENFITNKASEQPAPAAEVKIPSRNNDFVNKFFSDDEKAAYDKLEQESAEAKQMVKAKREEVANKAFEDLGKPAPEKAHTVSDNVSGIQMSDGAREKYGDNLTPKEIKLLAFQGSIVPIEVENGDPLYSLPAETSPNFKDFGGNLESAKAASIKGKQTNDATAKALQEQAEKRKKDAEGDNKIQSWIDKWNELKAENNTEQLDLFYNKVKVALNGIAQSKGVVDEFNQLKTDIEAFAKERKATGEAGKPKVGDVLFDSKKGEEVTVTKVTKPQKGSALENEPYIIDVKYRDGRKAMNMPIGERFKLKVEQSLKETTKAETPTTNTGVEEGSGVGGDVKANNNNIENEINDVRNAKTKEEFIKASERLVGMNPYDAGAVSMGTRAALMTPSSFERGKELFLDEIKNTIEIKRQAELKAVEQSLKETPKATNDALKDVEDIKNKNWYHGSENEFNEFENKNPNITGFWFSDSKENALTYGNKVKEVKLDIKNPLIIDAKGKKFTNDIEVEVLAKYPNEEPYLTKIELPIDEIVWMVKNGKRGNSFIEIPNHSQYDAVVFKNIIDPSLTSRSETPQTSIAVLNNSQIKPTSALATNTPTPTKKTQKEKVKDVLEEGEQQKVFTIDSDDNVIEIEVIKKGERASSVKMPDGSIGIRTNSEMFPSSEEAYKYLGKTADPSDQEIMDNLDPNDGWIGHQPRENVVKNQIFRQIQNGTREKRESETERIFELFKTKTQNEKSTSQTRDTGAILSDAETIIAEAKTAQTEEAISESLDKIETAIEEMTSKIGKLTEVYSTDNIDHEQPNIPIGKLAKKEITKYAKEIAKLTGWTIPEKNGVYANIAPAGGEVMMKFDIPGTPLQMYVQVRYNEENRDYAFGHFFYRVENPEAKGQKQYVGSNQWENSNKTAIELAIILQKEAKPYIASHQAQAEGAGTKTVPDVPRPTKTTISEIAKANPDKIIIGSMPKQEPKTKPAEKSEKRKIRDEKAMKEIDDAWGDFLGDSDLLTSGGLDPKKIEAGTKLIGLYIKQGVYKFSDIAQDAYAKFGDKLVNILNELKAVYSAYYNTTSDDIASQMDESVRNITFDDIVYMVNLKNNPKGNFVNDVQDKLRLNEKLNIVSIRKLAAKNGLTDISDTALQEYVELAIINQAKEIVAQDISDDEKFEKIKELYQTQPTISMRSSERIEKQQYSTPIPISFVSGEYVSHIDPQRVLEPSAGNGMMVFNVPTDKVIANEIDEVRLSNLQEQPFLMITNQDGTLPFNIKPVDAVVTNPPFGPAPAKLYGDQYNVSGLDEQMTLNALETMKDDGRAAIVIGGHTKYKDNGSLASQKAFLNYLYNYYNVADIINIDGNLYSKQGTSFDVRLILINGRRTNTDERRFAPLQKDAKADVVKTFDELYNREKSVENENLPQPNPADTIGGTSNQSTEGNKRPSIGTGNQTSGTTSQRGQGKSGISSSRPSGNTSDGESAGANTGNNGNRPSSPSDELNERPASKGSNKGKFDIQLQREDPLQLSDRPNKPTRKVDHTSEKVDYIPQSKSGQIGSVIPTNMAGPLSDILSQFGDIDAYAQNKLQYKSKEELYKALSAEQVDSVALAIYQIENGKGLIIGDMTGVGKGRQAAAIIRYGVLSGYKPIFITEKPHLFSDIYRDMKAIGSAQMVPFIVNDKSTDSDPTITDEDGAIIYKPLSAAVKRPIYESGSLPPGYDYMVITYSQLSSGMNKPSAKKSFFANAAMNNVLVMDESHNAGGAGNTGSYLQEVLPGSKGVVFLSGTFAKRPDNIPIYSAKTSMSDANMSNEELINAIKSGGVPLQEIMAKNLVEVGQMIRRERDFNGVTIDWETMDESLEEHTKIFDGVIEVFNELINFQSDYVDPVIEQMNDEMQAEHGTADVAQGTADLGISNAPFASKTFNLVRQLLLSLKAEDTAKVVIEELKAGRKPVVGISNTMGSFLADMGISDGDQLSNIDYSLTLKKGLDGLFRFTERDFAGNPTHGQLTVNDLSKEGQEEYQRLVDKIKKISSGITISPIDVIKKMVREAGFTIGELTGRDYELMLDDNGGAVVSKRRDKDKKKLARDFNSGELDVLIINQSGSTGISLHASETFKDKRQRVMISAQTQLDVNTEIQLRGRIDRTGQKLRGAYRYIISPIPAEQRLIMMFKAKLKSLDANTTSSQKSKTNEIEITDFLNKYGDEIVVEYLKENRGIAEKMHDPFKWDGKSEEDIENYTPEEGASSKVSGRAALLTVKEQSEFYKEVSERYSTLINYLNDNNANDLEIKTLPLNAETIDRMVIVKGSGNGNPFSEDSIIETVEVDVLKKPMKSEEILQEIEKLTGGRSNQEYRADNIEKIESYTASQLEKERADITEDYAKKEKRVADVARSTAVRNNEEPDAAVANALADLNTARDLRIGRAAEKRRNTSQNLINVFKSFNVGKPNLVPTSVDVGAQTSFSEGIFIGFKMKPKMNPSNISAVFATLDGRRRVEIPLSKLNYINAIIAQSTFKSDKGATLENWDTKTSKGTRRKGYIITGNILQAYAVESNGQLVTFTTKDGGLKQGILLPDSYERKDAQMRVQIIDGLSQIQSGQAITDIAREVTISPQRGGGYTIAVPLSKVRGGKYFLDDRLRDMIDDRNFRQVSGRMEGAISDGRLEDVLRYLSSKHNTSIEIAAQRPQRQGDSADTQLMALANEGPVTTISKEAFDGVIGKLKKAFPGVDVFHDRDTLDKKLKKGGIELRTVNGTVYGTKFSDGSIYLNSDVMNANAPIHEFSHLWEQYFPREWKRGVDMIEQSKEGKKIFADLKANPIYSSKPDAEIWSEALNVAIGNKGEQFVNNKNLFAQFTDWVSRLFKRLGDRLGIRNMTPDEKLQDFTKKVVGQLLGGKNLIKNNVPSKAFAKNQIKLADGSNTTFNPDTNDIRFMIIGEGGAKGLENAEAVLDDLKVAKEMEVAGKDAKTIRLATSWEKGADGKWRFEILDNGNINADAIEIDSKRIRAKAYKLGDLYNNKELYKSYPELRDITVNIITKAKEDTSLNAGDWNGKEINMYYGENYLQERDIERIAELQNLLKSEKGSMDYAHKTSVAANISRKFPSDITNQQADEIIENEIERLKEEPISNKGKNSFKSILIHEIQHAIQDIEGFAKGGNVNDIALKEKLSLAGVETVAQLNEKIQILDKEYQKIYKEWEYKAFKKRYKGQTEESRKLLNEWQSIDNQIKDLKNNSYDYGNAYIKYKQLAGEVEARNVQTRMNMTPEERKAKMLVETEDVVREQQIILMEGLVMASAKSIPDLFPDLSSRRIDLIKNIVESGQPKERLQALVDNQIADGLIEESDGSDIMRLYDYLTQPAKEPVPEPPAEPKKEKVKLPSPPPPITPTGEALSAEEDKAINRILNKRLDEFNYPNILFDENLVPINGEFKQDTAITQSAKQDDRPVDGTYVKQSLDQLREISLQTARELEELLGRGWAAKTLTYLESGGGHKPAQAIGVLNVISTQIFNNLQDSDGLSTSQYNELRNQQRRVDLLTNDIARQTSLGLNMRRIYKLFAEGGNINSAIAEQVLTAEVRKEIDALKESLSRPKTDAEINQASRPVNPTATTKTSPTTRTSSRETPDELKKKFKDKAESMNKKGTDLMDRVKNVISSISKTKCP